MPRKQIPAFSTRKPTLAAVPKPEAVERFVAGATDTPKSRRTLRRADGREVRRSVLYLPAELHQRAMVRAAEQSVSLSSLVADAVERALR